jgi:acyl-CoA reductase-like NAD-dependent aldehyde dehydrogenase
VGDALVRHPGIRKVHFTGGGTTARTVIRAAADNRTPVVAELGGKSAHIIFDDADLDTAAMLSAHQGPLMQSGQSCACASRLLVHESVYDGFTEKFLAVVGAAISQGAVDRILHSIDTAVAQGTGDRLIGGHRIGGELAKGYYVEPTVLAT